MKSVRKVRVIGNGHWHWDACRDLPQTRIITKPWGALTPQASVNCAGYSNVLMTADAEQTLPLKVVETLGCNQAVYVVADSTGYTARVRTADGKEGYVARMNLTMSATGAGSLAASQPPMATPVNGVVRWRAGAAGCDQFTSKGHQVLSASAEGVTVQISLEDTGWKLRTTVGDLQ